MRQARRVAYTSLLKPDWAAESLPTFSPYLNLNDQQPAKLGQSIAQPS